MRVGFLWFFLALAAVTSGRWWTAALTAVVAAAAGYQTARAWAFARVELPEADDEFAQMASEFDTIAELREDLTKQVTDQRDALFETKQKEIMEV